MCITNNISVAVYLDVTAYKMLCRFTVTIALHYEIATFMLN